MPAPSFNKPLEEMLGKNNISYTYYDSKRDEFGQSRPSRICELTLPNLNSNPFNDKIVMMVFSIRDQKGVLKIHSEGVERMEPGTTVPSRNKAIELAEKYSCKYMSIAIVGDNINLPQNHVMNDYIISIESFNYGNETGVSIEGFVQELESLNRPSFYRKKVIYKGREYSFAFVNKTIFATYAQLFDSRPYKSTVNEITDVNCERIEQGQVKRELVYETKLEKEFARNRIIFGAPGTGKSRMLNDEAVKLLGIGDDKDYERVTFHSNYSYANFVGTYKPIMVSDVNGQVPNDETKRVITILQDKTKTAQEKYDLLYDDFNGGRLSILPILLSAYTDEDYTTYKSDGTDSLDGNNSEKCYGRAIRQYLNLSDTVNVKKEIAYEYVPGPFMRVLVKALRSAMSDDPKPYLLIVEEINRANPAAVFGDVFQLLDRDSNGVSEYSISTSQDMRTYLAQELGVDESAVETIKIPNNMFIWATMNSADQGVFPMDTAFKRRWDFEYLGIDAKEEKVGKYSIPVGKGANRKYVYWNELRKEINEQLSSDECKVNEDKLLGPFFLSTTLLEKAMESTKSQDSFVKIFESKVLMYLFEDAMKMSPKKIFKGFENDKGRLTFSKICEAFETTGVDIFGLNVQVYDEPPKAE